MAESYLVQSVVRGMRILEVVAASDRPQSFAEIATVVGLNRATTYRLCLTLRDLSYLEISGGLVSSGIRGVVLGEAALRSRELPQLAEPYLVTLQESTASTVNLVQQDGDHVVYLMRLKTVDLVNINLSVGSRLPICASSVGRAILAYLPDDEQEELLANAKLTARTKYSITDIAELRRELSRIKERGYAMVDQELAVGLRGVAAPILSGGFPVAAISAATVGESKEEFEAATAPRVLEAAAAISAIVGGSMSGVSRVGGIG